MESARVLGSYKQSVFATLGHFKYVTCTPPSQRLCWESSRTHQPCMRVSISVSKWFPSEQPPAPLPVLGRHFSPLLLNRQRALIPPCNDFMGGFQTRP